jgi:hypothetical protein
MCAKQDVNERAEVEEEKEAELFAMLTDLLVIITKDANIFCRFVCLFKIFIWQTDRSTIEFNIVDHRDHD